MALDRRRFLAALSVLGASAAALPEVLAAEAEKPGSLTAETLARADEVIGLPLTDAERKMMLEGVEENLASYRALRQVEVPNPVAPALRFNPLPAGAAPPAGESAVAMSRGAAERPAADDELALLSATDLSRLLAKGEVSAVELTRLYLDRLERYGPLLECVVTPTPERALAEAERADRERAAGKVRGPLHGIPWGAKDLLAARGYRTTWGAKPYEDQVIDEDATVVARLGDAGAALLAKLTLGALAWGDVWFGGKTRNPWNPEQGSSGSSAGSAAGVAAGLVGFAIGSETWGSIVSPSTRCGATGLRPTFGRVSRAGAMALSWSMDKLGPLARSVEDCALVLAAIHGADGKDASAVDAPFRWQPDADPRRLRVGYVKSLFDAAPEEGQEEGHAFDLATLAALTDLGFTLTPVELPGDLPIPALSFILAAEAAAAFDELTRGGRDNLLVRQEQQAWPNVFRESRLIPAVEYIQANRVRTLLIERMAALFTAVDLYVVPSFGGDNLLLNNLTGHPCVVLPNGFKADGTPTSITFVGNLFGEGDLLAVAKAYQDSTGFHLRHPDMEAALRKRQEQEEAPAAAAQG
jgi:Asp-tRNA(Asn)/Glu-tRNA(Gln) amidotransferase A subunit family amidase